MEPQLKDHATNIFKYFHTSIIHLSVKFFNELGRKTYVTPTSYLELIGCFERLITKKQEETMLAKLRLVNALNILLLLSFIVYLRKPTQRLIYRAIYHSRPSRECYLACLNY